VASTSGRSVEEARGARELAFVVGYNRSVAKPHGLRSRRHIGEWRGIRVAFAPLVMTTL
jgi:hypothetical protein